MTKFYVLRTNLASVTEVAEIEADNEADAWKAVENGDGTFLGLHVGDYSSFSVEETEVLPAEPQNLPAHFYPAGSST